MPFSFLWADWEMLKDWEVKKWSTDSGTIWFWDFILSLPDDEEVPKKIEKQEFSKEVKSALESFPHIIDNIVLYWWSPNDFNEYLKSLLTVGWDRLTRKWFPKEVISELNMLHHVHDEVFWYPVVKKQDYHIHDDPWNIHPKLK